MKSVSKKELSYRFFSKGLYLQGLKLSKVAGICFLIITLFANALWIIAAAWSSSPFKITSPVITGGNIAPLYFIVFLSGAIISYELFSFNKKRKNSDFFNSVPQTRLCVFISFTASILTWIIVSLLITFLFCSLLWCAFGDYTVEWSALLPMISGAFCACAVFSGIVTLCNTLSGTFSAFIAYLVSLSAAPRIIINVIIFFFEHTQSTVIAEFTWLKYFTGVEYSYIYPFMNCAQNQTGLFEKPSFIFSLLIEAFILFAISGLLFIRTKSEATDDPYVYKPVHIAMRASVILSILAGTIALGEIDVLVVGIALLVHFVYDLVSLKKVKTALKSLCWYLLPVGLCFVLLAVGKLTGEAFELFGPNEKNTTAVSIYNNFYNDMHLTWLECNEVNYNLWAKDETTIKTALDALSEGEKRGGDLFDNYSEIEEYILVKFRNKNGNESIRKIPISEQDYISILKGVKSEEENKKALSLPQWSDISESKLNLYYSTIDLTKEIYDQFAEEYNSLSPENKAISEIHVRKIMVRFCLDEKWYFFHLDHELFPETTKLIYSSTGSAQAFKEQIKTIMDNTDAKESLNVISTTTEENIRVYVSNSALWNDFYNALDTNAMSDIWDVNKLYYLKLEDNYYFFSLDENILSILQEME